MCILQVDQVGAKLTVTCETHPYDIAVFLVNEEVVDTPEKSHFSLRTTDEFKVKVLEVWGAGGRRSLTKLVTKCNGCGELEGDCWCGRRAIAGTSKVPADRFDEACGLDGRLLPLGPRPNATRWPGD